MPPFCVGIFSPKIETNFKNVEERNSIFKLTPRAFQISLSRATVLHSANPKIVLKLIADGLEIDHEAVGRADGLTKLPNEYRG